MSSIEIRTYVTGFPPHSFIVVTGPDGIEHGFGLVPLTPNSPNDVGHIQDDTDHRWDKSTGKIPLEDWQYQRVMDYIHESEANPPTYSAAFGSQCSTWAFMALFKADIPTSGIIPHMAPDGIIQDFLETLIFNPYTQWMNLEARDFFDSAFRWFRRRDPLVLDLNGNGIETTGANPTNPILFDHDGNGIKNGTGWVSPNDGFLVLDRNGNGTIDNGTELFGDSTPLANGTHATDGFAALAQYDSNGDGVISSADAQFANLRVWRDLNQDGVSQAGELFTLSDVGIASINLANTNNTVNLGNGNTIASQGTFTRTDGTTAAIGGTSLADVNLAEDTFHREFPDHIPLAPGVEVLPNMRGSGLVRDMWEAASESITLKNALTSFSAAATRSEQKELLDGVLYDWARTSGLLTMQERADQGFDVDDPHLGGRHFEMELDFMQIGSVNRPYMGPVYDFDPGADEMRAAQIAWNALVDRTKSLFTVLEAFNGRYFFRIPGDDPAVKGASSGLSIGTASGGGGGAIALGPVPLYIALSQVQIDDLNASYDALKESVYSALVLQTRLQPLLDKIVLTVNDNGTGLTLDFTDVKTELQNRIATNAVDGMGDLLDFNFATKDQLAGTSWDGWNLLEQNLRTLPVTSDLQSLYTEFGVNFAAVSGGTLNGSTKRDIVLGSDVQDTISTGMGDDVVYAGDGNDSVQGQDGNDVLFGESGADSLYGGAGNDVLDGGAGNDSLSGDAGNDTYLFGRGDGQDIISNYDPTAGRNDVLQLKSGVAVSDVQLTRSGQDLIVKIAGTTDQVTVSYFFYNDGDVGTYALNAIKFDDGTSWDLNTIKTLVIQGTAGVDTLTAYASGSTISGQGGNDYLYGAAGNDVLDGGDGNDYVTGAAGNDTLLGGASADTLYGGAGNDVLDGGAGNDSLSGDAGSDTYLFGRGDGQDIISNYDSTAGRNDVLQLKSGVAVSDVQLTRSGQDLIVKIAGTTDQVTVSYFFYNDGDVGTYALNAIKFDDGTSWDLNTIKTLVIQGTAGADTLTAYASGSTISGQGGNDYLYGAAGNDVLDGGDGNDYVTGAAGNDTLLGGAGADTLYGGAGNDVLDGGAGNDSLSGDADSDTYLFGRGDGQDIISNYDPTAGRNDVLQLKSGVAVSDVQLTRSGQDLIVKIAGTTDQVTVSYFFYNDGDVGSYALNAIKFDDGTSWDLNTIKTKVQQGTNAMGGGVANSDLQLGDSGNYLFLEASSAEQPSYQSLYASGSAAEQLNLKVIDEALQGFSSDSSEVLENRVQPINFLDGVDRFDDSPATNPVLTSWALMNALTDFQMSGTDAALGGELTYGFGDDGSLSGISAASERTVVNHTKVGMGLQALNPNVSLFSGPTQLS